MPPAVEALADSALVTVLTPDDQVCGTGFVIDESGAVLTCHHVVDGLASVQLRGADGSTELADSDRIVYAPEVDLALIRTSARLGNPLAVVSEAGATTDFWTKGFHRLGEEIRAAFPVQGRIIGRTSVSYSSGDCDYDIDDVFVLRDDTIEPGLSGAPVLDPEVGVVVGVVSTRLLRQNDPGGFAVPISHALANPLLSEVIMRNEATIPAYGPYLNAPAARLLCKSVTESEIETLRELRRVDLDRRVPRLEIDDATAQFLTADMAVFALIGPSGVGKSTEIAALARRLPGQALLLRGSSLRPDSISVADVIESALTAVANGLLLPNNVGIAAARALPVDAGLIVLIDALNEAPLDRQAFEEWIARTRSWLRQTSARLIISCRPELWGETVGQLLPATLDHRESVVVSLGGFSSRELIEARRAYGLPPSIDWPILRLPLALSLYARSERRPVVNSEDLSINDVIETYIEETSRRLAKIRAGSPMSTQVTRDRLAEVAAQMWERDADVLRIQSFSEIFGTTEIVDSLVLEGVMSATPAGYRFVYDDVTSWLQAQRIDLDGELSTIAHDEQVSWRHVATAAMALRDFGRRDGIESLCARLMHLVEDAGTNDSLAIRVVEGTLLKVADARPYSAVLNRMVDFTTKADESLDDSLLFWRSVPMPLRERMGLLERLVSLDSYYGWRSKDWAMSLGPLEYLTHFSMVVYQLVQEEPNVGILALHPWLDNTTKLSGGEATVADVAMGILYRLRKQQTQLVWSVIIKAGAQCDKLITRLAMNDSEWLARMVSGTQSTEADDRFVINAAGMLERLSLPGEVMEPVRRAVADRYARGLNPELQSSALVILIKGEDDSRYVKPLIQAYRDGLPGADEWILSSAFSKAGDAVLPLMAEALDQEGRRETALAALASSDDAAVQAFADQLVRHYLEDASGVVDYSVCRYAEERLYKTAVPSDDLLAVIRHVIAAPPDSYRKILAYPLTNPRALRNQADRAALLQEFIDRPDDPEAISEAADGLIRALVEDPPLPDALTLLTRVLTRMDGHAADLKLLRAAFYERDKGFANMLAQFLTTGALTTLGTYTNQIKESVEAGEEPQRTVDQIYRNRRNLK